MLDNHKKDTLKNSQEKLAIVFETMEEGLALNEFIRNEQGEIIDYRIIEVNSAYERITKLPYDYVLNKPATELYGMSSEYIGQFWKQLPETIRSIKTEYFDEPSNEWYLVSTSHAIEDKFVTSFFNITDRKLMEAKLQASELKFRTIADFTYDWEYWQTKEKTFNYMSPSCLRITGYTFEEFIADPSLLQKIVHPEDLSNFINHQNRNLQTEGFDAVCDLEFRIIHKSGQIVHIQHICRPIFDDNENHIGRRVSNRDITEKKQFENHLKLLSKATEQSPVTVVITDKKGNITYVNPKFSELTGYTLDEVIGNSPRILQSGHQTKEFYQHFWDTILSGRDWKGDFHNKKKNGELYWESAVVTSIRDNNGEITSFIAVKEDITEKKNIIQDLIVAKDKAEESDRLKTAFLANVSHEIRTPMNGILGFAELLKETDLSGDKQKEYIQIIEKSGNRLLNIINDIIDISKIDSGQKELNITETNINQQLDFILKFFKLEVEKNGLNLILTDTLPEKESNILSDREKIYAILTNLVNNAIKFTKTGTISFGYLLKQSGSKLKDKNDSFLEFFIKDTGIGIPIDQQSLIFERFRQANVQNDRHNEGSGLGLSISKAYVEMLGGKIWLESVVGQGTTFYFTIPYKTLS